METLGLNFTGDFAETQYCFPQQKGSCLRSQTQTLIKAAMYIFMAYTILLTVCGNMLVIISISHFKLLHSPTNLLILSLACVDWCLGAFVLPYSMIRSVEHCWYFGATVCKIHSALDMTMSIASIFHLCLISIDRYCAICRPFWYRSSVTMQKVACLIAITWFISFVFSFGVIFSKINLVGMEEFFAKYSCVGACLHVYNKEWAIVSAFVAFFVPGTIMTSLYLKIFSVARSHAKKIADSLAAPNAEINKKNQSVDQREKKAAKTLAIVMGVFVLCWFPFLIILMVDPFINFSTPPSVADAIVWLGYFNSTCNPLIYGFFYPWFQKVFKIIISGQIFQNGSSLLNIYVENV